METIILSEAALALFRLHIELHGNILIDDANREPYRELARAGLMILGNSFRDGPGTIYRISKLGSNGRPNCCRARRKRDDWMDSGRGGVDGHGLLSRVSSVW